jgi:putative endonuclease
MTEKSGYVYILTNKKDGVLYVGMMNNLIRRITEHKEEKIEGFSKRYGLHKLVYYEYFEHPIFAINREKQLKAGSREQKVKLIESINPEWEDLFENVKEIY